MSQGLQADGAIAVVKIGGSILTSARAYRQAALCLQRWSQSAGHERLVVVVSAQEGVTDSLERAARKIVREPHSAALDILWSTGELRSVALLALHLQALGVRTVGLNIHEAGLTVERNGRTGAENVRVKAKRLRAVLASYSIAVVPGFFASDSESAVVSLGRGGSDLTAVLLAVGLEACRCELVKDVPGYFTADPHRDRTARHVPFLTFDEALNLADCGCELVQRAAIEAAARVGLPLVIRSLRERAPVSRVASHELGAADIGIHAEVAAV